MVVVMSKCRSSSVSIGAGQDAFWPLGWVGRALFLVAILVMAPAEAARDGDDNTSELASLLAMSSVTSKVNSSPSNGGQKNALSADLVRDAATQASALATTVAQKLDAYHQDVHALSVAMQAMDTAVEKLSSAYQQEVSEGEKVRTQPLDLNLARGGGGTELLQERADSGLGGRSSQPAENKKNATAFLSLDEQSLWNLPALEGLIGNELPSKELNVATQSGSHSSHVLLEESTKKSRQQSQAQQLKESRVASSSEHVQHHRVAAKAKMKKQDAKQQGKDLRVAVSNKGMARAVQQQRKDEQKAKEANRAAAQHTDGQRLMPPSAPAALPGPGPAPHPVERRGASPELDPSGPQEDPLNGDAGDAFIEEQGEAEQEDADSPPENSVLAGAALDNGGEDGYVGEKGGQQPPPDAQEAEKDDIKVEDPSQHGKSDALSGMGLLRQAVAALQVLQQKQGDHTDVAAQEVQGDVADLSTEVAEPLQSDAAEAVGAEEDYEEILVPQDDDLGAGDVPAPEPNQKQGDKEPQQEEQDLGAAFEGESSSASQLLQEQQQQGQDVEDEAPEDEGLPESLPLAENPSMDEEKATVAAVPSAPAAPQKQRQQHWDSVQAEVAKTLREVREHPSDESWLEEGQGSKEAAPHIGSLLQSAAHSRRMMSKAALRRELESILGRIDEVALLQHHGRDTASLDADVDLLAQWDGHTKQQVQQRSHRRTAKQKMKGNAAALAQKSRSRRSR